MKKIIVLAWMLLSTLASAKPIPEPPESTSYATVAGLESPDAPPYTVITPDEMQMIWMSLGFLMIIIVMLILARLKQEATTRALYYAKEELFEKADALAKSEEQRASMLAVLSHELRTPMSAIKMIINSNTAKTIDEDSWTLIDISTNHLLDVLESLQLIAHSKSKAKPRIERTDMNALIQSVVSTMNPIVDRNNMTLTFNTLPETVPLHASSSQIRQTMMNLIKNAAVHSKGTNIHLEVSEYENLKDKVVYSIFIHDDGIGINAEKKTKLYEAFERGTTDTDGTGLGLYICKELITGFGGTINLVDSKVGTSFEIRLPIDKCLRQSPCPLTGHKRVHGDGVDVSTSLEGVTILLAEDNPTIRLLTKKIIESTGAELLIASNGADALALYRANKLKINIVLTDIMMPVMNGYELTKELRNLGFARPIVGVTAATIGDETDAIINCGANDVISKPMSKQDLVYVVTRLLTNSPKLIDLKNVDNSDRSCYH